MGYESPSSSSSAEEGEESENEEQIEEPKKLHFKNAKLAKISDNIKAQPEYEAFYNNKLLRSHTTNIHKVYYISFKLFL